MSCSISNMQNTNFRKSISSIKDSLFSQLTGSWRKKSFALISLLLGFYLTNNLVSYYLDKNLNSVLIVLLLVVFSELIIRLRYLGFNINKSLLLVIFDNFRIGTTYALVLEAYKLGS